MSRLLHIVALGAFLLGMTSAPEVAAATPYSDAMTHMDNELLALARPLVEEVERAHPGRAKAVLVRSRMLFPEGDFVG